MKELEREVRLAEPKFYGGMAQAVDREDVKLMDYVVSEVGKRLEAIEEKLG